MDINIMIADYENEKHGRDIGYLLNCYASDPMGGGKPLDQYVIDNLAFELAKIPGAFSILGYVDWKPAALANCFTGFSTFRCRPLVNIHDIVVAKEFRGSGLCGRLLQKIQEIAYEKDCCKLTLEVLEGNKGAQKAYEKFGFSGYELNPETGKALFWEKKL